MSKTIGQVEKNVSASFGYVKKDLLMLNDVVSDIQDKIQHLSLNHASLLEEVTHLAEKVEKKTPSKNIVKKKVKVIKKNLKKKSQTKKTAKKTPKKVITTEEVVY